MSYDDIGSMMMMWSIISIAMGCVIAKQQWRIGKLETRIREMQQKPQCPLPEQLDEYRKIVGDPGPVYGRTPGNSFYTSTYPYPGLDRRDNEVQLPSGWLARDVARASERIKDFTTPRPNLGPAD